jgi:hypothetical protein
MLGSLTTGQRAIDCGWVGVKVPQAEGAGFLDSGGVHFLLSLSLTHYAGDEYQGERVGRCGCVGGSVQALHQESGLCRRLLQR